MTKLFLLTISLLALSGCAHRTVVVTKEPVYDYGIYPGLVSTVPVVVYGGWNGYHHRHNYVGHHYRRHR